MGVNEAIKHALLRSPLVFKNRLDVIEHMLFVIGNGYEWKNGELCTSSEKVLTIPDAVIDILNRNLLYDNNNLLKIYESQGMQHKFFQSIINQVKDIFRLDERMNDSSREEDRPFYTLSRYSDICNIPDDIKPDWLELIEEVLDNLKDNPDLLDDPENLFPDVIDRFYKIKLERQGMEYWGNAKEVDREIPSN